MKKTKLHKHEDVLRFINNTRKKKQKNTHHCKEIQHILSSGEFIEISIFDFLKVLLKALLLILFSYFSAGYPTADIASSFVDPMTAFV